MLIKEYLIIVKQVVDKIRDPCKYELLSIKTLIQQYKKDFKFKIYIKKIFQEYTFLNLFLFFIFRMVYDFLMFIFYTLDLYFTFFLK